MQQNGMSSRSLPESRDLFLSHRSSDKELTRQIVADIEAEAYGNRTLITWFDEAEIRPGQSIPGQIERGLEISQFVGLVLTPSYFESSSGWPEAEWHAALHSDPDNRSGRIIPLLAVDCPYIPYLLRHLDAIDLRGDRYAEGLRRLISVLRNEPLPRPVAHRGQLITPRGRIDRSTLVAERAIPDADPDVISERLYCNLLPIERLPAYVYAAPIASALYRIRADGTSALPTKEALRNEIRAAQKDQDHPYMPAFRVFEDRIITFHDPEGGDSPLAAIIQPEGEVDAYSCEQLLQDEESRNIVISLLNMALSRHMNRAGLVIDDVKPGRYFFPPKNGGESIVAWRPRTTRATRTVAKPMAANGHTQFWRHLGAYMKVIYLASRLYLFIKPTWVLTSDGSQVMTGPDVGKRVIKWTGAERNLQVLFHVRFWTTVLKIGPGPLSFRVGDQRMEMASVPAMIQLPYGIAFDQRDLMAQLEQEAELLAQEEDALADAAAKEEISRVEAATADVENNEYEEDYLPEFAFEEDFDGE